MNKFIIKFIEEKLENKVNSKQILMYVWMMMKIVENSGEFSIDNLSLAFMFKTSSSEIGIRLRQCGLFDCVSKTKTSLSVYKIKPEILEQLKG